MKTLIAAVVLALALPAAALAVSVPPPDDGTLPRLPRPVTRTLPGTGTLPLGSGPGTTTPAWDTEALDGARFLGPANLGWISADVVMQMRDEAGLLRYARLVSDPHSLYYRHFLTPRQIGDYFGAPRTEYDRAAQYFLAHGIGVRGWKQRQMLRIVGPQANVERALSTRFGWFRRDGIVFFAPTSSPRFSVPLAVRGVSGIVNYHRMRRPLDSIKPWRPMIGWGPGFLTGSSPFALGAAFDYIGAYNINTGCCRGDGITIGIVGTGPISSADVPFFKTTFNVVGRSTVTQVNVSDVFAACCYSNGLATPPPVTAPCLGSLPSCNPEDFEAQLDTEQTASLAPDATVLFYLAYNPNECFAPGTCPAGSGTPQLGIGEVDDELQQIVSDNNADVVSASYGIGEQDYASAGNPLLHPDGTGAEPDIYASMVAEGMAIFYSSGDSGAEGCQRDGNASTADIICADYPSTDPSVVSVGGTNTPVQSNGRLEGILSAWGIASQTGGAGGGAFSSVFGRPPYQPAGTFCDSSARFCDTSHRLVPDLSLEADPATGVAETVNCGTGPSCAGLGGALLGNQGGTSASAPAMAAMWALVLEACKQTTGCGGGFGSGHGYRLGNPAPLLYAIYDGNKKLPYQSVFYDITYGNNAVPLSTSGGNYAQLDPGFSAGAGFDLATGLGAPFARNLIKAITGM